MTDDFSNYPESVTKLRSDRTDDPRDWTPRDVLLDVLRQLDSGKIKPETLIVMWADPETPKGENPRYNDMQASFACKSKLAAAGLAFHGADLVRQAYINEFIPD